jgi:hypothetical protein
MLPVTLARFAPPLTAIKLLASLCSLCHNARPSKGLLKTLCLAERPSNRGTLRRLASSSAPNLHRQHRDASQRSMVPARLANMPRGGLKEGSRGSDPRLLGLTMGGYLIALSGSDPVDQRSTAPRVRPIAKLARLWAELRHVPMNMALRGCKSALPPASPTIRAAAARYEHFVNIGQRIR